MQTIKSLDELDIIATLLRDAHALFGAIFSARALRLTLKKVEQRYKNEGIRFLTVALPRLGKAFDKALLGSSCLNSEGLGFKPNANSVLPIFMGEFFSQVFSKDGVLLQEPNTKCIAFIRDFLYCFYKYEVPFKVKHEKQVVEAFKKAENDLRTHSTTLAAKQAVVEKYYADRNRGQRDLDVTNETAIILDARELLAKLFLQFDPTDIKPRHGPGAVATKQTLWDKYRWSNVSSRITEKYPFDAYFCASLGEVCDNYQEHMLIGETSLPARVILVPKDSRGPRLISCEPVDYQWVQQGLSQAIVRLVENSELTKFNVFFTDQAPNQRGALLGSSTGRYATLDLQEASDRVSLDLVRMLFPKALVGYLEACRSLSTVLPDGEEFKLDKFAPMGSALCFPVLALTVWSLLSAGAPDADTRDGILVYGDDVIVPTAYAESAMTILESFGLKINRDKSCYHGFFRESCGVDAFKGINVTPVRFRTVWSESPSPDVYTSWIAYANSLFDRRYRQTYDLIVGSLLAIYGHIPEGIHPETDLKKAGGWAATSDEERFNSVPSLRLVPDGSRPNRRRWNKDLQRFETRVWAVKSPRISKTMEGWSMLLRYFTENDNRDVQHVVRGLPDASWAKDLSPSAFRVSQYTKRRTSRLVRRWR